MPISRGKTRETIRGVSTMNTRQLGRAGEELARRYLKDTGFHILATNFRCRFGELDIIARDRECLVFVEVKTRKHDAGFAQAVTPQKIGKMTRSARFFLQREGMEKEDFRLMILFVHLPGGNISRARVEVLEGPF